MSLTTPYGGYDLALEDFLTAKILVEIKKRLSLESASQDKSRRIKGTIEHVTHELTESKGPKQMFMTAGHAIQAMHQLHRHCKMQHGDISPKNIKFYESSSGEPVGILYDFDHYTTANVQM